MRLAPIDQCLIALYFAAVVAIGFRLRRRIRSSRDFLLSNRSIPLWMTGISFMAANLGSLEIMGMVANGAKYGMLTNHFYWVGAIPAMVFLGLFMMPFYYRNNVRSVPEYLKRRFDSRTHALNSLVFAVMTILMSGINMFALAIVLKAMLGWSFHASVLASAGVVVVYTSLGGLSSSIYNEVLQFALIVVGFLPLSWMAFRKAGGWNGLAARLPDAMLHTWRDMGSGAGPIGLNCLAALRASGCLRILCLDRRPERLELARSWGAWQVFESCEALAAAAGRTHPAGADIVVEAAGSPELLEAATRMVRFGGRLLLAGYFRQAAVPLKPDLVHERNVAVIGAGNNTGFTGTAAAAVSAGLLRTDQMITHRFAIEEYATALNPHSAERPGYIKGVFLF